MSAELSILAREIDKLCKKKKISRYALAKFSGMPDSSIRNMYQKGTNPGFDSLDRMCRGMDMTVADFFHESDAFEDYTADQKELMEIFKRMDENGQQLLLAYAEGIMADNKKRKRGGE